MPSIRAPHGWLFGESPSVGAPWSQARSLLPCPPTWAPPLPCSHFCLGRWVQVLDRTGPRTGAEEGLSVGVSMSPLCPRMWPRGGDWLGRHKGVGSYGVWEGMGRCPGTPPTNVGEPPAIVLWRLVPESQQPSAPAQGWEGNSGGGGAAEQPLPWGDLLEEPPGSRHPDRRIPGRVALPHGLAPGLPRSMALRRPLKLGDLCSASSALPAVHCCLSQAVPRFHAPDRRGVREASLGVVGQVVDSPGWDSCV